MSVTLREIAESTGYTEATVSNAINNRGRMSEQTRRTILERAKELGYSPNNSARSLAVRRSGEIGVVIPNIDNPVYSRMVSQITILCRKSGYESIFADSYESIDVEIEAVSRMVSRRVEGLLIAPVNYDISPAEYLPMLEMNHIKYMFISNCLPGRNVPYVMTDLSKGAEMLTEHLLDSGRRKLVLFVGQSNNPISSHRLDGCRKAFEQYDIDFNQAVQIPCSQYNYEEGYNKTKELLKSDAQVDAIIAINDFMAAGAETALKEESIRIPDDIAIAGYDDMFFSKMLLSPLTTVRQDVDRMSRIGVEALLTMIESDKQTNDSILLSPELIVRASTLK